MEGPIVDIARFTCLDVSKICIPGWRWKVSDPIVSHKIENSMRKYGQVKNIVIRKLGDIYEIIDGAEIYQAAKVVGMTHILCYDVGEMDDVKAKEMCMSIDLNKAEVDVLGLARVVKNLPVSNNVLASSTPYNEDDLDNLRKLLEFDWGVFAPEEDPTPMLFNL